MIWPLGTLVIISAPVVVVHAAQAAAIFKAAAAKAHPGRGRQGWPRPGVGPCNGANEVTHAPSV